METKIKFKEITIAYKEKAIQLVGLEIKFKEKEILSWEKETRSAVICQAKKWKKQWLFCRKH